MTKEFPVIYEWAGANFSGHAPDVAGCMATAKTLPLIRSMLKDALEAHLQWMKDDGDALPSPFDSVTVEMEPDAEFPQPAGYYVIVEKLNITMPKSKTSKPKIAKAKRTAPKRRVLQAA